MALNKGMEYRKICQICGKKPCAVNYKMHGKTYYRSRCDGCIRKNKNLPIAKPSWFLAGYKKKPQCEKCGFKAKYKEQLFVYYVDGNFNNNNQLNLRTICANCQYEIAREALGWRQGDLVPDF
jgi:ribosomal protein S27AE